MFGRVKKWLGIEGVKVELDLQEEYSKSEGMIEGKIRFFSQNTQTVELIRIKILERYSRGKEDEQLIDEYDMGQIYLDDPIEIPANEPIEIDFGLPFKLVKSEMDELEEKNILAGGLVKAAKWFRGVKSEYRIEATVKVKGTALDPFDRQTVNLV